MCDDHYNMVEWMNDEHKREPIDNTTIDVIVKANECVPCDILWTERVKKINKNVVHHFNSAEGQFNRISYLCKVHYNTTIHHFKHR